MKKWIFGIKKGISNIQDRISIFKEIDGIFLYKKWILDISNLFSNIKNDCYFLILENDFLILEIHFQKIV